MNEQQPAPSPVWVKEWIDQELRLSNDNPSPEPLFQIGWMAALTHVRENCPMLDESGQNKEVGAKVILDRMEAMGDKLEKITVEGLMRTVNQLQTQNENLKKEVAINQWFEYPKVRPTEYGSYEVYRGKCQKQHFETWNNTGWAYNHNSITYWRHIVPPRNF